MKTCLTVVLTCVFLNSMSVNAQKSIPVDTRDPDTIPLLDITKIKSRLTSTLPEERDKAVHEILGGYFMLKSEDQAKISRIICELIDQPVEKDEGWDDPDTVRNQACYLAGELKLGGAVSLLINLLKSKDGQIMSSSLQSGARIVGGKRIPNYADGTPETELGPAAYALIKIGSAAKEPLQKTWISTKDEGLKKIIKYILAEIKNNK